MLECGFIESSTPATRFSAIVLPSHCQLNNVLSELRRAQGDRSIDWLIGDLPVAHADAVLIKQVWTNLLSNTIKYTRPRLTARIEIGCKSAESETTYYVKDNGVGFDMADADKLFGVFQRPHSEEEYEGTGVGLAIVERIVRRHGGRVWAEAQVDKGPLSFSRWHRQTPAEPNRCI